MEPRHERGSVTDDSRYLMDGVLADWHRWCQGYRYAADIGSSAMFRNAKTPRGPGEKGDEEEIIDARLRDSKMEAANAQIVQLTPLQYTAIQINALNLATGRSVWTSARLPTDIKERAMLLADARTALMVRLIEVGVI